MRPRNHVKQGCPWPGAGRFNEAGAMRPRNQGSYHVAAWIPAVASMRPGPCGPGIPPGPGQPRLVAAASMRPGPCGPGIHGRRVGRERAIRRFNEAGAMRPRNRLFVGWGTIGRKRGFNEAGAMRPRNRCNRRDNRRQDDRLQ